MSESLITNSLKTLRFLHGEMTQQHLADRLGVTRQTIASIEKGKYSPTLLLAFRIAEIFGKPLEEIFTYHPNTSGNGE